MSKRYGQACPLARSLEIIGDRWTLLIVRDLLPGSRRFQDLLISLRGIAPDILSDRLKLLTAHGLVERKFYSEHPPRAEYVLTRKGEELGVVVGSIAEWGSRHVYRRASVVHVDCGHRVKVRYVCPHCGGRIPGKSVALKGSTPRRRAVSRKLTAR